MYSPERFMMLNSDMEKEISLEKNLAFIYPCLGQYRCTFRMHGDFIANQR